MAHICWPTGRKPEDRSNWPVREAATGTSGELGEQGQGLEDRHYRCWGRHREAVGQFRVLSGLTRQVWREICRPDLNNFCWVKNRKNGPLVEFWTERLEDLRLEYLPFTRL